MNQRNVGEALLTRLKQLGVDYFFANPGTEFFSVIRGFQEMEKESVPTPILAPHEFLAVSMAYGYYLATKKPQAVMTHVNVGAANALIGLIGASRMKIPILFISGMTSQSERDTFGHRDKLIHWSHDSKDQGSIFREYVKWEAEISDPSVVCDVLDRAYAIAMSAPRGPVAIKISRDILESDKVKSFSDQISVRSHAAPMPDLEVMDQIKTLLATATKPLIVTNRLGADESAVAFLRRCSEKHQIGVLTPEDFYLSFPADHPNHLGCQQSEALQESDLVLVLDTESPWYPLENGPNAGAKVVHVGPDPLFQAIPLRSHRGDLFLQSCLKSFLAGLSEFSATDSLIGARREWISLKKSATVRKAPEESTLNIESVSSVLSGIFNPDTILINELSLAADYLQCRHPGTYFRSGSASPLGWGVGCALGLCLADQRKTVIAAVGDGVFYLSPILPTLLLSARLGAPVIILVLNNGGMQSIAKKASEFYPNSSGNLPLTSFYGNETDFEKCAAMVSGLGLRATTPPELCRALAEGIEFCREQRRPVIINAIFSEVGQ